jgi:hypothetical protein
MTMAFFASSKTSSGIGSRRLSETMSWFLRTKGRMRASQRAKAPAWSFGVRVSSLASSKGPINARLVPCPVNGVGQ